MKVLFINGSPKKDGYANRILHYIEDGLDSSYEVEFINVYDLNFKPCRSCFQCRPDGNCIMPEDDGHSAWHKIRSADALIVSSPTYYGNMTGHLKSLFDRTLTAFENIAKSGLEMPTPLHIGKKAALVTTCASPHPYSQSLTQSKGALQAMENVLKAGGYDIIGSLTLDGTPCLNEVPLEIQEEARNIGRSL